MRLSLSIEDTNRLRAKVGLRLLRDGPEAHTDDVSRPSERVRQIQARIMAATERTEERSLHAAATQGPAIASTAPESTLSWLDKMRQKRNTNATITPSEPKPIVSLQTGEENIGNQRVNETPLPNVANIPSESIENTAVFNAPEVSQITHRTPHSIFNTPRQHFHREKEQSTIVTDPLQAPAEPRKELKRSTHLDYDSKKTMFKPKKLKPTSRTRTRDIEHTSEPLEDKTQEPENDHALAKSRSVNSKSRPGNPEAHSTLASEPFVMDKLKSEEDTASLTISPTQSFLNELRQNHQYTFREQTPVQEDLTPREQVSYGTELNEDSEEEDDTGTTQTNSIAETLRMLQEDQKIVPSSKVAAKSRREWTQRLASTRLAKQAELDSSIEAFKHLPSHERQKAYELHKKGLVAQDAKAAKEIFQHYTPDVNFERRDEQGNVIDGRKAFKLLSSKFHGAKSQPNKHKSSEKSARGGSVHH